MDELTRPEVEQILSKDELSSKEVKDILNFLLKRDIEVRAHYNNIVFPTIVASVEISSFIIKVFSPMIPNMHPSVLSELAGLRDKLDDIFSLLKPDSTVH